MFIKFNDKQMNLKSREIVALIVSTCIFILSNILAIYVPSILGKVIDIITSTNKSNSVRDYVFIFAIISLLIILLQYVSSKILNKLNKKINIRMCTYVFNKIRKMNLIYWFKESKGEIITIISNDIYNITDFITNSIPNLFSLIISTIMIFIYIMRSSLWIAFIIFLLNIVLVVIQYMMSRVVKIKSRDVRNLNAEVNSKVQACINNVENLLLKDYLKSSSENYNRSNKKLFIANNNLMDLILRSSTLNLLASLCSIFIIIAIGGHLANTGNISTGRLVTLILYSQKIFSPITNITKILMKFNTILPKKTKIDQLLDNQDMIEDFTNFDQLLEHKLNFKTIIANDLETGYLDDNIKIENLSIDFTKSNVIGIIGDNGVGKTTIIKLIRKLLPIKKGKIKIDNTPLEDIGIGELSRNIQIMPQTDSLNQYDIKYIKSKLQEYYLNVDIEMFIGDTSKIFKSSDKYEYNINSKGELQKLSFLNTIFKDAKLYILDEPSASIDLKSEKYMSKIIKALSKDKKFIIITHRPELLNICDYIINL
ncbi:ABC transporter transmembrane domain-containing protein [Finegoldia magna]|uniref:ABC transporter transmembrane domain-containing protein n=1 Tax=Finegoldia magna TaxID=1260 RepID=UPI0012B0AA04|nr:ABC transporter ATP-binding protein [Finegoldia magna]MSB17477.1 ATP-binding cassette domain-containing protein [Finegoldia magna]MSD46198.1 ATP-binding cassette domain-containing protein [Finegoldia magna]